MAIPQQLPIAVRRPNAPLAIVWIVLEQRDRRGAPMVINPTLAYIESQIRAAFGDEWQSFRVIEARDVPTDRTFRDAWRDRDGVIEVDLPAAKALHRTAIDRRAAARIEALERQVVTALVTGAPASRMALLRDRRLALLAARDDARIDAAASVDELAAIDPLASIADD
mgnify:CR=1 FL=1